MISDSKIILQRINLPEEKENCNISTWPLDSNNCTALSTGSKFSDWSLPCHCTGLIHFVIQHSAMEFVKTVDVTPSKHNTVLVVMLWWIMMKTRNALRGGEDTGELAIWLTEVKWRWADLLACTLHCKRAEFFINFSHNKISYNNSRKM